MSLSKRKQFMKLCSREILISSLWWNWKLIKTCSIIFSVKVFWVSRSNIRRADLFLFYFHSGIQQFPGITSGTTLFLGRCKLSRPGSRWGEKGFHPFPKQISCSQVTREKKISEGSEPSGSSVFAPIPPTPHYGAWSQANVNCRRVVVCRFFWGAFGAGREGEEGRDRRGHGSLGLSNKLLS